jgi:transglutaminase-like putative cysteine protease
MRIFARATALFLLAIPLSAVASSDSVPDWVLEATKVPLPTYPATTRAVVLLDEEALIVQPDGTATSHERRVIKILRPEGRHDAMIGVWSDVDEKLSYLHAWSVGPDGHQYAVKDKEFADTGADEGGMLYLSLKARILRPPAADPGAVIAYEYERKQRPYVNEAVWHFQEDIPVYRSVFEVDLPQGWKYYAAWLRHAPVASSAPAPEHYRWELQAVPALDMTGVENAPSFGSLVGRMTVHYAKEDLPPAPQRWAAIGEWYTNLASPQGTVTQEIAAKAKNLTAGESDFAAKLQTITEYLQTNIRYVGIEIGIGGWQPHTAADTFRNGYGDCKDKATLLKAMLDAVGIRATWVLVDTRRGYIDPAFPSIYGDHMIAAIELPPGDRNPAFLATVNGVSGKRYLIFDPTDPFTPVGQLRPELQGSYGVLADGSQSEIFQLPKLPPDTNLLERAAKFDLSQDGTLKGAVTENRSGSEAWAPRRLFAQTNAKDEREVLEHRLREDFSSFTLDSDNAENASQLSKPFVLRYSFTASQYARLEGNLMLVRPRILGSDAVGLDDKPRVYPVDLGAMRTERDVFDLQLPVGYVVDETPDPVSITTDFATYRSKTQIDGNILHYTRELVVNQLELKPEQYSDLRQFMGQVEADEESLVVLKKQ